MLPTPGVPSAVDADGDGSAASLSPFAQVLSQLQQLQQTDPTKLKSVLGSIATELDAAAQQAGPNGGQGLSDLANRFQQAAQTGDVSGLQPHRHHHGHHHGGAAAYQQTSDQSSLLGAPSGNVDAYDPRAQALDIIESVLGAASTTAAAG